MTMIVIVCVGMLIAVLAGWSIGTKWSSIEPLSTPLPDLTEIKAMQPERAWGIRSLSRLFR